MGRLRRLTAAWLAPLLLLSGAVVAPAAPEPAVASECDRAPTYALLGLPDLFCDEDVFDEEGLATVFIKISSGRGDPPKFACSGSRIGRSHILTAAHCFSGCGSACAAIVGFGDDIGPKARLADVVAIHLYPQENGISDMRGADFAVLRLAEHDVAPDQRQTARILLARSFLTMQPSELTVSGFGVNSVSDRSKFGERFANHVPVRSYACVEPETEVFGCIPFKEFVLVSSKGDDTCDGDSGGPALIRDRAPRVIVGVTSRPFIQRADNCGSGGIYGLVGTLPVLRWLASHVPDLRIISDGSVLRPQRRTGDAQ